MPAVLYGLELAANQRDGVPSLALDSHGPLNSWAALGAAAFAVALTALLTALGIEGFPIPGWSAASGAAVCGATALAHPDNPGTEERGWASFAIAWAVVFVLGRRARAAARSPRQGPLPGTRNDPQEPSTAQNTRVMLNDGSRDPISDRRAGAITGAQREDVLQNMRLCSDF